MISKDCPLIITHVPKTGGMFASGTACKWRICTTFRLAERVLARRSARVGKKQNKETKEIKVPLPLKCRIKEMNLLDSKLYEWISARCEKQLVAPPAPVQVSGGGRTDFDQVKLWRAIDSSPIRKMVMENSPANRRQNLP